MCRWNAWFGQPILVDELLYRTPHSLIDQSLHARMGVETTNGDGFGLGWYDGRNGGIHGFDVMRRDLMLAVEPSLFDGITGSTDSETLFYLALSFGLADDPVGAVERAVGFVEATAQAHDIEHPVQMTLGFSDGDRLWAVRYSSEGKSRTLYVSADVDSVKALHPENARFQRLTDEDRVIVSEPLSD